MIHLLSIEFLRPAPRRCERVSALRRTGEHSKHRLMNHALLNLAPLNHDTHTIR